MKAVTLPPRGAVARGGAHLQDPLVVDFVEDGAVDLVGLERHPVEDGHPELCLDWLLDFNSYVGRKKSFNGLVISYIKHTHADQQVDGGLGLVESIDEHSIQLLWFIT